MRIDHWSRIGAGGPVLRGLARCLARGVSAAAVGAAAALSAPAIAQPKDAVPAAPVREERTGAPAQDHALAAQEQQSWSVVLLDGRRAGYVHSTERVADGLISSTERLVLSIARGGDAVIRMEIDSEWVETEAGVPVRATVKQNVFGGLTETRYTFAPDRLSVTAETLPQGGRRQVREIALPSGDWLTPVAAGRAVRTALSAETLPQTLVTRTLDLSSSPQVARTERSGFERTSVEVFGRSVPAIRCNTRVSVLPGAASAEYLDLEGTPVRTTMSFGAMSLEIVAADRDLALAELEPPELMASTLITPDRAIERPRERRRAVYELRLPSGQLDIPSGGTQRAEVLGEGRARVVVSVGEPLAADDASRELEGFTRSSPMLDSEDAEVVGLARRAMAGTPDDAPPLERAEALRRAVYGHIARKSLGVGFASASEVVRSREGDCTEHGVLLAAVLRTAGMPSRVVSGVIYADEFIGEEGVFVYHMWTQVLLDPDGDGPVPLAWIDLDATLPPGAPFDATHIALSHADLAADGSGNPLVSLVPLLGALEIRIIEVE